jgi:ABC-2 type transport system ATP-binding protein
VIIHDGELMADGTLAELQHHFQGRPVIEVDVTGAGAADPSAWQTVKGVEAVEERPAAGEGVVSLRLATAKDADPRADLFRLAVDKGWTLLTLNRQVQSLENIFAQLTRKDAAAEAGEDAA